ncbi:MAG: phosphoribosylformylglycinamidine cyclo-ligase [Candidatus Atribacteria bacterium]|nr:phosphoribosylformylglycinamidine cyclo-ligase [Candidatus Atribacteria bacterium]MCD6349861.1 phosphoribosylformylglycinamidine cyclo-ligase [Candidatus Atribacteria bacterium]
MNQWDYKKAGVDIELANQFVKKIASHIQTLKSDQVVEGIGGFAGIFRIPDHPYKMCIAAACDGVGTKLEIAQRTRKNDTVGIDLVAMCVNDLLCVGAKPLFFMDYLACGKLEMEVLEEVIQGILEGCKRANCVLLGGETAEMPDMYREGEYDLAGFAIGEVSEEKIINGRLIAPGDAIVGLASSGLHSNGFSLVRKILKENNIDYNQKWEDKNLSSVLLEPTRIYVPLVLPLLESCPPKGIAHITGGGVLENLSRILPSNCDAWINKKAYPKMPIFSFLQKLGNVPEKEMWRVFNMGIGMITVFDEKKVDEALRILSDQGEKAYLIGKIVPGNRRVILVDE